MSINKYIKMSFTTPDVYVTGCNMKIFISKNKLYNP